MIFFNFFFHILGFSDSVEENAFHLSSALERRVVVGECGKYMSAAGLLVLMWYRKLIHVFNYYQLFYLFTKNTKTMMISEIKDEHENFFRLCHCEIWCDSRQSTSIRMICDMRMRADQTKGESFFFRFDFFKSWYLRWIMERHRHEKDLPRFRLNFTCENISFQFPWHFSISSSHLW